jgi:hypothetical protein
MLSQKFIVVAHIFDGFNWLVVGKRKQELTRNRLSSAARGFLRVRWNDLLAA